MKNAHAAQVMKPWALALTVMRSLAVSETAVATVEAETEVKGMAPLAMAVRASPSSDARHSRWCHWLCGRPPPRLPAAPAPPAALGVPRSPTACCSSRRALRRRSGRRATRRPRDPFWMYGVFPRAPTASRPQGRGRESRDPPSLRRCSRKASGPRCTAWPPGFAVQKWGFPRAPTAWAPSALPGTEGPG